MPTVDEELWVIPEVMIIIATHADIRSTSQKKPRYVKKPSQAVALTGKSHIYLLL
jgi:hypothetical protein